MAMPLRSIGLSDDQIFLASEDRIEKTSSLQQRELSKRISWLADPLFYRLYSFFYPIPMCEKFEPLELCLDYTDPPISYEQVILLHRNRRDANVRGGNLESAGYAAGDIEKYLDNPKYACPVFRKSEARWYWESTLNKTLKRDTQEQRAKSYWTKALCDVEMRELYANEYKEKLNQLAADDQKFLFRIAGGKCPEDVAKEHRVAWNRMPPREKLQKICLSERSSYYASAITGLTFFAGGYYLFSRPGY